MSNQQPNRLVSEKSPYLLQHAYNPVDWYPWGQEAFQTAKEQQKPVFLSIGYSTCHWCHVMEEESFEDKEVAALLNDQFVPIKVDREERPDVDSVYMKVCQSLTGQGGWPLTIIMTPEKKPFFAGTYFPKTAKRGRPGLIQILEQVADAWQNDREKLVATGQEIVNQLQQQEDNISPTEVDSQQLQKLLDDAVSILKDTFDFEYGGFGRAPKFPQPHNLMFLLRYNKLTDDSQTLKMVEKTLDNLYQGGIYDQIGGGFARYSTDRKWLIPHFEKMLYDNALLAITYLEAYQATDNENYAAVAEEVLDYLVREMQGSEGGFYSAEDADTKAGEGAFYLWDKQEIEDILKEEQADFCSVFDITESGNFEGKNIPNLIKSGVNKLEIKENYTADLQTLFQERKKRERPFKDDKVLTGWNGLAIAAFSLGARVLDADKYQTIAEEAAAFIFDKLKEPERLLARYRDGEADYLAYSQDYVFLIWGLIELYTATRQPKYLTQAVELNQELINYFWDQEQGGLYQSGTDSEELIISTKEIRDGALPSANSVAALNWLRLADLVGSEQLRQKAEQQIETFYSRLQHNPSAYTYFLTAVMYRKAESKEIVAVGDSRQQLQEVEKVLINQFAPFTVSIVVTPEEKESLLAINSEIKGKSSFSKQPTIYICENYSCRAPITNVEEFKKKFNK